jgi:hypothetical protein
MISSSEQNLSTDLTLYWPISNGEIKDLIDLKDVAQGHVTFFTLDKFGNENSLLTLKWWMDM